MSEENQKDVRMVGIAEAAVKKAEAYIAKQKTENGISLTRGAVFAMALNKMVEPDG